MFGLVDVYNTGPNWLLPLQGFFHRRSGVSIAQPNLINLKKTHSSCPSSAPLPVRPSTLATCHRRKLSGSPVVAGLSGDSLPGVSFNVYCCRTRLYNQWETPAIDFIGRCPSSGPSTGGCQLGGRSRWWWVSPSPCRHPKPLGRGRHFGWRATPPV